MDHRSRTRPVMVGGVTIGGGAPISVQSMAKTDTRNARATIEQIRDLANAGCEIIRVAVPDAEAAAVLAQIKQGIDIPLAADIHFDYRLALKALEAGVDKLRINPGNIGEPWKVKAVVGEAASRRIPIRIGVNAGSLEKPLLEKYGRATPEAMVDSALGHVQILEELGFRDIVISLKASDVRTTIEAYRLLSQKVDYPLHVGITEAGTVWSGTIKSAVGIGTLLAEGIGDTLRVSLTGPPSEEVRVGFEILKALGLRERGPVIVSCPTCGRCRINLVQVASEVEKRIAHLRQPIRVAIMGCVVNGPGEARHADIGLAGGKGAGVLFRAGEVVGTTSEEEMVEALVREAQRLAAE